MAPEYGTATSLEPSAEEATAYQPCVGALVKRGALSWPGLDAASTVAKLELGKPPPAATPASATNDR